MRVRHETAGLGRVRETHCPVELPEVPTAALLKHEEFVDAEPWSGPNDQTRLEESESEMKNGAA